MTWKLNKQEKIELAEQTANWYKDKSQKKDHLIKIIKLLVKKNTESKLVLKFIDKIEKRDCI